MPYACWTRRVHQALSRGHARDPAFPGQDRRMPGRVGDTMISGMAVEMMLPDTMPAFRRTEDAHLLIGGRQPPRARPFAGRRDVTRPRAELGSLDQPRRRRRIAGGPTLAELPDARDDQDDLASKRGPASTRRATCPSIVTAGTPTDQGLRRRRVHRGGEQTRHRARACRAPPVTASSVTKLIRETSASAATSWPTHQPDGRHHRFRRLGLLQTRTTTNRARLPHPVRRDVCRRQHRGGGGQGAGARSGAVPTAPSLTASGPTSARATRRSSR